MPDIGSVSEALFCHKTEGQQEPWLSLNATGAQKWPDKVPPNLLQQTPKHISFPSVLCTVLTCFPLFFYA